MGLASDILNAQSVFMPFLEYRDMFRAFGPHLIGAGLVCDPAPLDRDLHFFLLSITIKVELG